MVSGAQKVKDEQRLKIRVVWLFGYININFGSWMEVDWVAYTN
jgi:hypothetical protein